VKIDRQIQVCRFHSITQNKKQQALAGLLFRYFFGAKGRITPSFPSPLLMFADWAGGFAFAAGLSGRSVAFL